VNGTLHVASGGAVLDTLDVSSRGTMLVTTSSAAGSEIKILDNSGALSETIPIDSRVKQAKFAPNSDSIAIFAFEGASAQVWDLTNKQMIYEVRSHSDSVTDVSFPPMEGLVAVSSADGSWSLHDYTRGVVMLHLRDQAKISALQFHPDGLIMAVGLANGKILVYDIRDMQLASELEAATAAPVKQLCFSNKGIFLAASWEGYHTCRVYSLHKGFAVSEIKQSGQAITCLSFDLYGGFLAVGTSDGLGISSYKNWKKNLMSLHPFENNGVHSMNFEASGRKIFVTNRAHGEIVTLSLQ